MAEELNSTMPVTAHTTLNPAINTWKVYLEDQGKSIHTIKAFLSDLNLLATFLPPDIMLGNISTVELNHFLDWIKEGRGVPCSPKTLARRITSIKSFFRWLHAFGAIPVDPAEKVIQKTVISPLPTILTKTETDLAVAATNRSRAGEKPDARPAALLQLLLATGIKKSECLALSPKHVELEGPTGPFLFVRYSDPNKRYKERKIDLPHDWIEVYKEYQSQHQLNDQLFPWSQRRLEYILEDIGKEAGLNKQISFLMCRWTCAVNDWIKGEEQDSIRQKLGVSKIQWRELKMKIGKLAEAQINSQVEPAD